MLNRPAQDKPMADPGRHIPALDGVRGVAVLLVVFYHFATSLEVLGLTSPVLTAFHFGWCGVDVFFALSGFLITGILLDTKEAPHYFKSFYARRILRIFPLYYGAIIVVFALRAILPHAGVWGNHNGLLSPGSFMWPLFFLENIAPLNGSVNVTGVLTHYWSLAVEEHFYLVWPLAIWLTSRQQALWLAIGAAALSLAIRILTYRHIPDLYTIFGVTPLRMDGLAIGAIAAILLRTHGAGAMVRPAWLLLIASLAALVALLAIRQTVEQTDHANWIFFYPLVAASTAATLLICSAHGWLSRLLSFGVLRWFGRYSFGLYIWHPIVGMLLFHSKIALVSATASPIRILTVAGFVFLLDLTIAWASFTFFEKHFLDLKRNFRPGAEVGARAIGAPAMAAEP
jgi:peptidoglycan/LPS O-acetylase OafA/YrhL